MIKSENLFFVFLMLIFSCNEDSKKYINRNRQEEPIEFRNYVTKIRSSIIGIWDVSKISFSEIGLNNEASKKVLIGESSFQQKERIHLEFNKNGNFLINRKKVGSWEIDNNAEVFIQGKNLFTTPPIFINTAYRFGKNYSCGYLTTTFINRNRVEYQVQYIIIPQK
jgi:hypothetical protein